jgi:hypothetical protein
MGTSHMTPDLLGNIFRHLCYQGPLPLRHLLFVSRVFYHAAVSNAYLWTTISFDACFASHFHSQPKHGNIFVEHCLLRSRSLSLCLDIDYYDPGQNDPGFFLGALETFGKPALRGFERCTSLVWRHAWRESTLVPRIVALLPTELPSLKRISLSSLAGPQDGSQFPNCPVLERVEIFSHASLRLSCWGTIVHVTTLSFGNYLRWSSDDIATLSVFPELHYLTLFSESRFPPLVHDSQQPIQFQHLKALRIHGRTPSDVLTRFVAPALEELYINADSVGRTSIAALQSSLEPLCLHLDVLLPTYVSVKEPDWAANLSKLVQRCTWLQTLSISKWMEEEFKNYMDRSNVVLHVF